jgi:outer membrane protein assembly factor BamB
MRTILQAVALGIGVSLLSGCGYWSDVDPRAPQELVEFPVEKTLRAKWSTDIGAGFGDAYHQSTPAITETGIYIADAKGLVSSLSVQNGRRLWSVDLDENVSASAGAGFGVVSVALESGELVALRADNGELLWRVQMASEILAQPQINADKVVVQMTNGQVVALDRRNGEQVWVYDGQEPTLTLRGTGTPLLLRDGVLAGFANGKVVALALDTGAPVWEVRVSEATGRSEIERLVDLDGRFLIAGDLVYTGSYQGRLVALNPLNASTVWTREFSTHRSLAAGFGNIYAADSVGAVEAFDADSAASVWRNSDFQYRQLGSPAVLGNEVIVGDGFGYLHILSQVDGHHVGRYKLDSTAIYAEPVVVDNTLYILSNSGKLSALTLN